MSKILLLFLLNFPLYLYALSANEILEKSDLRRGLDGSFFLKAKTIFIDRDEKQINEYDVKVLNRDTSLVEQTKPERAKGRRLLMRGLDMWLMTPDIKKPVRISLQQKLTGDIQNGDVSRTNYAGDYTATLLEQESSKNFYVLDLKAKDQKVTYSAIKYWIEKKNFRPLQAEFFASGGKKLKTAKFTNYKIIDGLERMTRVIIEDSINSSKKSEIHYSHHKKQTYDESEFAKEQMIR